MARIPSDVVNAAARIIAPQAFEEGLPRLGCGGPWHYESHGYHSTCPSCGSSSWELGAALKRQRRERRARARIEARAIIRAVDRARATIEEESG